MSNDARTRTLSRSSLISAFVAAAVSFSSLGHASPLAIGTIESFDSRNATVVVLGQRLAIKSATLIAGAKSYPAAHAIRLLQPGAVVWVDGELNKDGTANVASLTVLPETNVPGATQLFVVGVVKAIDRTGKVRIGDLTVDTTPTLGETNSTTRVGDLIEVLGVQSSKNGVVGCRGCCATSAALIKAWVALGSTELAVPDSTELAALALRVSVAQDSTESVAPGSTESVAPGSTA